MAGHHGFELAAGRAFRSFVTVLVLLLLLAIVPALPWSTTTIIGSVHGGTILQVVLSVAAVYTIWSGAPAWRSLVLQVVGVGLARVLRVKDAAGDEHVQHALEQVVNLIALSLAFTVAMPTIEGVRAALPMLAWAAQAVALVFFVLGGWLLYQLVRDVQPLAELAWRTQPSAGDRPGAAEAAEARVCSACGRAAHVDDRFCARCGASLEAKSPTPALCPSCGSKGREDALYCPQCGQALRTVGSERPPA